MISRGARSELLWVLAGQVLTLLLGIVTLKALTYLLGPAEYGEFALGLSLAGVLNLFIYGPLGQAVSRYFHLCTEKGKLGQFDRLVTLLLRLVALIVAVITVLGWAAATWFDFHWHVGWDVLVLVALGYGVVGGTLSVYLADLNTRRERRAYAILQTADALVRLLCAAMIVLIAGTKASAALTGYLLGSVAAVLLARHALRDATKADGVDHPWQEIFGTGGVGKQFAGYASSFSLFAVPAIFSSYGDRWIIQQALSAADVGIYVALAQIANAPTNLLLSVFSQTLNPILFQRAGNADGANSESAAASVRASRYLLYRALLLLTVLLAIVTGVSFVFGELIVMLMTSSDFAPYARLLWILVLAAAIFQIAQGLASEAFVYNRPFLLLFPKMAHAAVFLGLSIWLVASRQLEGVAIAAVAGAVVYLVLVMTSNARARRQRTSAGSNSL